MTLSKKAKRNLELKKRYQLFRSLGFSANDARKKSQLKHIRVNQLQLFKTKTGRIKLKNNRKYKELKLRDDIEKYNNYYKNTPNRSVFTTWGNATHDQPIYDEYTMRIAKQISNYYHESLNFGYYYLYLASGGDRKDGKQFDFDYMDQQVNKDETWEKYRKPTIKRIKKTKTKTKKELTQEFKDMKSLEKYLAKNGK